LQKNFGMIWKLLIPIPRYYIHIVKKKIETSNLEEYIDRKKKDILNNVMDKGNLKKEEAKNVILSTNVEDIRHK